MRLLKYIVVFAQVTWQLSTTLEALLENMFYNFKRFDFSRVGRYKINKRLNLDVPNTIENRVMRLEDIEAIVAEIIRLNNTQEPADDID